MVKTGARVCHSVIAEWAVSGEKLATRCGLSIFRCARPVNRAFGCGRRTSVAEAAKDRRTCLPGNQNARIVESCGAGLRPAGSRSLWLRDSGGVGTSPLFHLPSSLFHLPSPIFHLPPSEVSEFFSCILFTESSESFSCILYTEVSESCTTASLARMVDRVRVTKTMIQASLPPLRHALFPTLVGHPVKAS